MSMISWLMFLVLISFFGFFYIILDNGTQILMVSQNATLNNTDNIKVMQYSQTMWYILPAVFLFIYGLWALNQAQKRE